MERACLRVAVSCNHWLCGALRLSPRDYLREGTEGLVHRGRVREGRRNSWLEHDDVRPRRLARSIRIPHRLAEVDFVGNLVVGAARTRAPLLQSTPAGSCCVLPHRQCLCRAGCCRSTALGQAVEPLRQRDQAPKVASTGYATQRRWRVRCAEDRSEATHDTGRTSSQGIWPPHNAKELLQANT